MSARRLRVAHVTTTAEFVRHILIHDLRRLRTRTDATVFCAPGPGLDEVAAEGFRVVTIPIERKIAPLADLRTVWRLAGLLGRGAFDLVHTYVPKGGLLGQVAGVVAGTRARVHSCRGMLYLPGMPWWQRSLFRVTDRLTNALATRTIYVSRADRDFCIRERLCSPAKARHTGSGIDLSHFDPTALPERARVELRARLGIPLDAYVILTVGRFVEEKGYRELAEAARALRQTCPEVRWLWVAPVMSGEAGMLPDDLAERTGVADVVVRVGMQDDVRAFYVAADLLAHPSYREGVPRVAMEAAAMGLPIVASDIPGCREVIEHERSGVLVEPGNQHALLEGLRRALADPEAMTSMAYHARARVLERFDQERLSGRIWEVYRELGAVEPAAEGQGA